MFKTRKAQAAMEFLMTYGWAILIVLAVIATLAAFGVLNTDMFLKEKCLFEMGVSCQDYKIVSDATAGTGEVTFKLFNGMGEDLMITDVVLSGRHLGTGICGGGFNDGYAAASGYSSISGTYTAAVAEVKDDQGNVITPATPASDNRYLAFPRDSTITFKLGDDDESTDLMFVGGDCSAIGRTSKGRKFNADVKLIYYKGTTIDPALSHPLPGQISITVE